MHASPENFPQSSVYARKPEEPGTWEERMLNNARQTRAAVVFIAWIVAIFAALTLIGVIVDAVIITHAINQVQNSGGTGL